MWVRASGRGVKGTCLEYTEPPYLLLQVNHPHSRLKPVSPLRIRPLATQGLCSSAAPTSAFIGSVSNESFSYYFSHMKGKKKTKQKASLTPLPSCSPLSTAELLTTLVPPAPWSPSALWLKAGLWRQNGCLKPATTLLAR